MGDKWRVMVGYGADSSRDGLTPDGSGAREQFLWFLAREEAYAEHHQTRLMSNTGNVIGLQAPRQDKIRESRNGTGGMWPSISRIVQYHVQFTLIRSSSRPLCVFAM